MSDILGTLSIGYSSYDEYANSFMKNALFKGKTLEDWEKEIELPALNESSNIEDLRLANIKYIEMLRLIVSNLSYAKSTLKVCEMHYERKMQQVRIEILEQYKDENPGKRVPGVDTINNVAQNQCMQEWISMGIAEAFLLFWQTQHDKIKYFDSRLTNLGFILNTEEKYQFRAN